VLHLPLQIPGLERFETASDFMRDTTTTTTHLSMRHDAARDAECRAALEVRSPQPQNLNFNNRRDHHDAVRFSS
jgi:hypothetical protein